MKTVYIPKGETVAYESLMTENLIVHGCLNVTYGVKAKHICGAGVIHAGTVAADRICATELECATVTCEKLIAKRVSAAEIFASDSAAVSCFLSVAYVETGRLTVSINEISEVKADEVINLKPKKRGMLRLLIASALKAWWLSLSAPGSVEADYNPVPETDAAAQSSNTELREEIAKSVREILAEQNGPDAEADTPVKAPASGHERDDFELKRVISLFQLCRDSGYTLRILPGTPEENAPVFDPEAGQIIRRAA